MGDYLGINSYLILISIGLTYTAFLTKNRKIRFLYKLRAICLYLLFLAGFYLYFFTRYYIAPDSSEMLMREIFFKYKMGIVGTHLFYLFSTFKCNYLITGFLTLSIFIILSILCVREIRIARRNRKEAKRKRIEEENLRNKIAIKEKLEREEKEKREKHEKAREEEIRKKINETFSDENFFEQIILEGEKNEIDTGFKIS